MWLLFFLPTCVEPSGKRSRGVTTGLRRREIAQLRPDFALSPHA